MSKLFEEVLSDAKKLKELAEQNAKNAIIENLSPVIKTMIEKEINGAASSLFEEDETLMGGTDKNSTQTNAPIAVSGGKQLDVPMVDDQGKITVDFEDLFDKSDEEGSQELPQTAAAAEMPVMPPVAAPEAPAAELPAPTPEAPPAEQPGPEAAATPIPTPGAPPVAPEETAPALTEEEDEAVTYETFSIQLESIKKKINESASLTEIGKYYLKEQILKLYGFLEKLAENKNLPQKIISLNENRLEVLYKKLKELKLVTNYNKEKGQVEMASGLKKMTKKLMEETSTSKDEVSHGKETKMQLKNNETDKAADAAGKHAMNVTKPGYVDTSNSSAPKGPDQLLKADDYLENGEPEVKFWNEEIAKLEAELAEAMKSDDEDEDLDESHGEDSTGHMMTAAQEEPKDKVSESKDEEDDEDEELEEEVVYEVDEAELAEAVRSLRKESIKSKMKALKEEYEELEESESSDEEDEELDECMDGVESEEDEMAVPGAMGPMASPMSMEDEDVVITISTNDGTMHVSDPGHDEPELGGHEMGDHLGHDEDELDLDFGDEGEEGEEMEHEDMSVADLKREQEEDEDEMAMPTMPMKEAKKAKKSAKNNMVRVSKPFTTALREAKEVKSLKEVKVLKNQLTENKLLTAKLIYLNRFLQKDNLSRKQKQKIVEYLDNAQTIEEAKAIYGRIEKVLNEVATTNKVVNGSSSKTIRSGSATINNDPTMISESRWQVLAGIKTKK